MHMIIRKEEAKDYEAVEKVVQRAFEPVEFSDKKEHELVARIRTSEAFIPELSLVAMNLENEEIIGHILFSKIKIVGEGKTAESLALAPVSVLPAYQNKGIGRRLIEEGIQAARELGYGSVIVLGHPEYYPKFGFKKASVWGIKAPFEVPDDAFMALELIENSLKDQSGVVEYSKAFFEA